MKVLLINGSPHVNGCTYTALAEVAGELNKQGVETEIFHLGTKPIQGCISCGHCWENKFCVFEDKVNEVQRKMDNFDGLIVGSAVHYAATSGQITAFLDRLFYSSDNLEFKPGAAIVSARRGGTTAALDQLNKYFSVNNMPLVSSNYWNMVHGNTAEQVMQDIEGMQTMRQLGRNMAWMLKMIEVAKENGINHPENEKKFFTNFIR